MFGAEVCAEGIQVGGSSPGMQAACEYNPCLKAFLDEAALPSTVLGPVDFLALARLISARVRLTDIYYTPRPDGSG